MRGMKIPLHDFALKMQGGLMREGGRICGTLRYLRQAWTKEQAPPLQTTKTILRTYTGHRRSHSHESLQVTVVYGSQQKVLPLIATEGQGPSLLGRSHIQGAGT